jgi:hypothetical protein
MLNKPEPEKVLGARVISRLGHQKNSPSVCSACGLGFTKDERIISHRRHDGNGAAFREYFHAQCWEKKFYDSSVTDEEIDRAIQELETLEKRGEAAIHVLEKRTEALTK